MEIEYNGTIDDFKLWIKSDDVVKTGKDEYKTQCTLYSKKFTRAELKNYFKKEYL